MYTPIRPFTRNLLVIDVETTGSNPLIHEVVDMGAVLLDGTTLVPIKEFSSLVRPESLAFVNPDSMKIHGLTESQMETAPLAPQVASTFSEQLGGDFTLCGWNICFDAQFLASFFRKVGKYDFFERIDYHKLDLWSLLESLWALGQLNVHPKSFSDVCSHFGLARDRNHRALQDALLSAEVLRRAFQSLMR
jgi:DNA polymerase III epsilon subunit-like protein